MSGNSQQRRKALRAAQRNGTPPKREKVEPEPRGEAEEVFEERKEVHRNLTDALRLLRPPEAVCVICGRAMILFDRTETHLHYACVFVEHNEHWFVPISPIVDLKDREPDTWEGVEETPPFLRNLEKRSWLWRLWNFVKRIWQ